MKARRLVRILLLTVMAFTLAFAGVIAVACSGEGEKVKAGPEGGEYYYDADGQEYLITLADGNEFTFVLGGEERSGSYSLAGTALTFTFEAAKNETPETLSATLRDYNSMTFTYRDVTYTFLRKTTFTVHFSADGAASIADQSVLNGKKAAKPTDPQKTDQLFVGWYKDSSFKEKYSFDSAVTSDITLYARFVSAIPDDPEFTVTFAPGEGVETPDPITTLKGIAYKLPEPVRAGDTFVGWWVSATNSPEELTYRYNEERLYENTTFYAVWESDLDGAPAVSVNAEGVSWTGSGNNYTLKITSPTGSEITRTLDTNSFAFGSGFRPETEGKYTVTVTLDGKSMTVYYVHKALARVSVFEVEGNILQFNSVANATSYRIEIDCKEGKHTADLVDEEGNAVNYYDFGECDMKPEGITFTVTASADGYVSSVSAPFVFERTLQQVTEITVDEATQLVTWKGVEGATSYSLVIMRGDETVFSEDVAVTEYSIKTLDPGSVKISVVPKAHGWNAPEAGEYTYEKTKLAVPTEMKLSGTTLSWKEVAGATGYTVTINGVEHSVQSASFELSEEDHIDGKSTEITIVAIASDSKNNSPISDVYRVTSGEMGEISYGAGRLTWDTVFGAKGYVVRVNEGEEQRTEGTSLEIVLTARTNTLYVRVDEENAQWKSITVEAYEISFDLGYDNTPPAPIYKADGDPISLEKANRLGYDFGGWFKGAEEYKLSTFTEKADLKLTAHWTPHKWTVKFNVDGGSDNIIKDMKVDYGSQDSKAEVPTPNQPGYAFEGWYAQKGGIGEKFFDYLGNASIPYNRDNDIELFAHYVSVLQFEKEDGENWSVKKDPTYIRLVDNVTIPDKYQGGTVTVISDFSNCNNLKILRIPETITSINLGETAAAFEGCLNLVSVEVYEVEGFNKTPRYYDVDGVLFQQNTETEGEKTIVYYPEGLYRKAESKEYTIPHGVERIGEGAFYNSGSSSALGFMLETINIPASVSSIAINAFHEIGSLTNVVFLPAEGDEKEATSLVIEKDAFSGSSATGIEKIKFPKRLKSLDVELLLGFRSLLTIEVEEENETFSAENGILYLKANSAGKKELAFYPRGNKTESFEIPTGVFSVGELAFKDYYTLKYLTIPAHVTNIAKSAFEGCTGLTTITFKGGANDDSLTIGEKAFYGRRVYSSGSSFNNSLTELHLPANLKKLGTMAFAQLSKCTEVWVEASGDDREEIEYEANAFVDVDFNNNSYVKTVHIGKDVPAFAVTDVFGGLLQTVTVADGSTSFKSDKGVLYNADMTELLFFPAEWNGDYTIPDEVTVISNSMFARRSGLSAVVIHDKVTSIGEDAFRDCVNLKTVTMKDGAAELSIGAGAFRGCKLLTDLHLPKNLVSIGKEAFKDCTSLTTITIPAAVKDMELGSFSGLETGDVFYIFSGCTNLKEIEIEEDSHYYAGIEGIIYSLRAVKENGVEKYVPDTLLYCAENASGTVKIPSSVRRVASRAFNGVHGVKIVEFQNLVSTENSDAEHPDTMELTLGERAFYACHDDNNAGIEEIRFPEGLKTIGQYTIYDCDALIKINVPNTVTTIASRAFSSLGALTTINFDEGGSEGLTIEDSETSKTNFGTTWTGAFALPKLTTIKFPARLVYLGSNIFTATEEHGSINTRYIKTVEFTSSTNFELKIGNNAFNSCSSLTEVIFADGLAEIGERAFYSCSNLAQISLPASLEKIGKDAFSSCNHLATITFAKESTITELTDGSTSSGVFYRCTSLETVELPASLKKIGVGAFRDCTALTTVTIPEGNHLETIGNSAFQGCTLLKDFNFGTSADGVALSIGESAFLNDRLPYFHFPENISVIGASAFSGNKTLATIEFKVNAETQTSKLESIGQNAFQSTALTKVEFPATENNNLKLGANMFKGCKSLTEVHLSRSIADFSGMLNGCGSIERIIVDRDNPYFTADPNKPIIYDSTGKSIMLIYADVSGVFEIAQGATKIAQSAFANLTEITEVHIPASVSEIGAFAFENCINLQKVVISSEGSALTFLGKGAFHNCKSLTSINLEVATMLATIESNIGGTTNVQSQGAQIFTGCTSLESLTLPAALEVKDVFHPNNPNNRQGSTLDRLFEGASIKHYDFSRCTKLTQLGSYMFASSAVVSVKLPTSLTCLNTYLFDGCADLSRINSDEEGTIDLSGLTSMMYINDRPEAYFSANFNINTSTSSCYTFQNCTSIKKVKFGDNLKYLGGYAFKGCSNLTTVEGFENIVGLASTYLFNGTAITSITIGPEVTRIGGNSFLDCTSLSQVTFLNPTKLEGFGSATFKNCSSLTTFDFAQFTQFYANADPFKVGSNAITSAFSGTGLTKVDLSVFASMKSLPDSLFQNCLQLTEVKLPTEALEFLGKNTFQNCPKLSKINSETEGTFDLSGIGNLTCIGNTKTASTTSDTVYTFDGCESVTKVILPAKCTKISGYVFQNCTKLEDINLDNVTLIGKYCFSNTGFEELKLSKTVTSWGEGAFYGCKKLTKLTLDGFASISGKWLFAECPLLETVIVPTTLTHLGTFTFENDVALKRIAASEEALKDGVFDFSETKLTRFSSGATGNVTSNSTDSGIFAGCLGLISVKLPTNFTQVARYAFRDCENLTSFDFTKITHIGSYAFQNTGLTSVQLGANLTTNVFYMPFEGCKSLTSITIATGNSAVTVQDGAIVNIKTGTIIAVCPNITVADETSGTVTLPEDVKALYDYSFYGVQGVKKLDMSKTSVTKIPQYAFYGSSIEEVVLPATLTEIGNYAFFGTKLQKITFPASLTKIGTCAFAETELVDVVIPNTLNSIGAGAFAFCKKLQSVVFENKGETSAELTLTDGTSGTPKPLEDGCFDSAGKAVTRGIFEASSVSSVTLGDRVTKLMCGMFAYTTELKSIEIPHTVTEFKRSVFYSSGITDIVVPSSVEKYNSDVFHSSALKSIKFEALADNSSSYTYGFLMDCKDLTKVDFGESTITRLDYDFLNGCSSLESVVLPDTITKINQRVFQDCVKLTSIKFPANLEMFSGGAVFGNTPLLKRIELPEGVSSLHADTFAGMTKDQTVCFAGSRYTTAQLCGMDWYLTSEATFEFGSAQEEAGTAAKNVEALEAPVTKKYGA